MGIGSDLITFFAINHASGTYQNVTRSDSYKSLVPSPKLVDKCALNW